MPAKRKRKVSKKKVVSKGKAGKMAKFVLKTRREVGGNGTEFTAVVKGNILGGLFWRQGFDKSTAVLSAFNVAGFLQGRGIGRKLVEQAIHHSWKKGVKELDVTPTDDSRKLFLRLGFKKKHPLLTILTLDVEEYFNKLKQKKG